MASGLYPIVLARITLYARSESGHINLKYCERLWNIADALSLSLPSLLVFTLYYSSRTLIWSSGCNERERSRSNIATSVYRVYYSKIEFTRCKRFLTRFLRTTKYRRMLRNGILCSRSIRNISMWFKTWFIFNCLHRNYLRLFIYVWLELAESNFNRKFFLSNSFLRRWTLKCYFVQ